jgi:ABC-type branched-subunit amino acid transport system ATPase component/ABC-type branched-subunit amino acid transport system permease subunit
MWPAPVVRRPWVHAPIAALALYFVGFVVGPQSYQGFLLTLSLIYLIAVFGLNIPGGMLGQLSLGHGAVFAIGAYLAAIGTVTYHWSLVPALVVATIVGFLAGIVIGIPASRLNVLGLGMISLGVTLVVADAATALSITGGPSGLVIPLVSLLPSLPPLSADDLYLVVIVVALAGYLLHWYLRTSHLGRVFLAIKSQEIGILALGANPYWYKVGGLAIGSALGALAGGLYAYLEQVVAPDAFGVNLSILFLLMVILGGAGTRVGPVIGTALLGIIPIVLNQYPDVNIYIYGGLLILIMRLRPRGIYGRSSAPVNAFFSRHRMQTAPPEPEESVRHPSPEPAGPATAALEKAGVEAEPRPVATRSTVISDTGLLTLAGVGKSFGGNRALKEVTLSVQLGEVISVVGPNGSGKTTLLNAISGYVSPYTGDIHLAGRSLNRLSPQRIARRGVARTFQVPKVFEPLSVAEHIALAESYAQKRTEAHALAMHFLHEIGLGPATYRLEVRTLGHGHRRFLEIGMAALRSPDVILLDEPAAGLSTVEIEHLITLMKRLGEAGVAVVVVEHHLDVVRRIADRVAVMHLGEILWCGPPELLGESSAVRDAYLGLA